MPTYAYKCPKCDTRHEISKPMADSDREERCDTGIGFTEQCNAILERDYANYSCNFVLKGPGWTGKIKKT